MLPSKRLDKQPEDDDINDIGSDSETTAAAIEATFDGRWGIWLSATGHWWATRRDPLTAADLSAGCVPFLRASNPDDLTHRIHDQEELHASTNARTRPRPAERRQPGTAERGSEPHE